MRTRLRSVVLPSVVLLVFAGAARAQQPASAPSAAPALPMPAIGDMAPDFTIRGATRYGLLRDPARLSDFRGQTVVLWLFVKARTRG